MEPLQYTGGMEKLNHDVLALIVDELGLLHCDDEQDGLRTYATISRAWQYAIEAHTFRDVSVKSTELDAFSGMYSPENAHRRAATRRLTFLVHIPTYGNSRAGRAKNNNTFRKAVKSFLGELEGWHGSLKLCIWPLTVTEPDDVRGVPSHLTLDDGTAASLPVVRVVTGFQVGWTHCEMHPTAMCQLAGVFPRLQTLDLLMDDDHQHHLRVERRAALARGLVRLKGLLPKLRSLSLACHSQPIYNYSFKCRSLEDEQRGVDEVSEAVRLLAQETVTELSLHGFLLSPDLFRDRSPPADQDAGATAAWPLLRRLVIDARLMGADGRWYFTGNPNKFRFLEGWSPVAPDDDHDSDSNSDSDSSVGSYRAADARTRDTEGDGEEPDNEWRDRADPGTFHPLIQELTTTVREHMPNLRVGSLRVSHSHSPSVTIACATAGERLPDNFSRDGSGSEDDDRVQQRRWDVYIGESTEWDIPEDLLEQWREWVGEEGSVCVKKQLFQRAWSSPLLYGQSTQGTQT